MFSDTMEAFSEARKPWPEVALDITNFLRSRRSMQFSGNRQVFIENADFSRYYLSDTAYLKKKHLVNSFL